MKPKENIILLADDDEDDQEILKEIFTLHTDHITILNVQNGIEALHALDLLRAKGLAPCLIILDINMPKMDGRETLLRIKKKVELDDVPVILFTTSTNAADKQFTEQHGANFVTKPFRYSNMEGVVKEFIAQCMLQP